MRTLAIGLLVVEAAIVPHLPTGSLVQDHTHHVRLRHGYQAKSSSEASRIDWPTPYPTTSPTPFPTFSPSPAPAAVPVQPAGPCVDMTNRTDLSDLTKMELLDKNDRLRRNQTLVKGVITDLQNRLTYAKADTIRLKAKQNSTERFCAGRKDQISARETYIETVKKQMQDKCDEAENGLGSDAFKDYIKKLNEKFNDARVAK
jgi:hypothetical protein